MIRVLLPTLLCFCTAAADEPPAQTLAVSADTPSVAIEPRPAGRGFVALPALEYRFLLELSCGPGWQPRSVSLGIADTRLTLAPEPTDGAVLEAELTVPATQLAPLPLAGFCEASVVPADAAPTGTPADQGEPPAAPPPTSELTIAAVASAQAALLCASEDDERLTFVARPLDVTLVCNGTAADSARSD